MNIYACFIALLLSFQDLIVNIKTLKGNIVRRTLYILIGSIYLSNVNLSYLNIQPKYFIISSMIGLCFFTIHIWMAKGIKLTTSDCNKGFIKTCILIYFIELPAEEFLYRGILLISLSNLFNPFIAIVVSSIIFGALHIKTWGDKSICMASLILGIICASAVIITGSIWSAIIIHNLNNFAYLSLVNKRNIFL